MVSRELRLLLPASQYRTTQRSRTRHSPAASHPSITSSGSNAPYVSPGPWHRSAIGADGGPLAIRPHDLESLTTPSRRTPVLCAGHGAARCPPLPWSQPPRFGKLYDCQACLRWEADSSGTTSRLAVVTVAPTAPPPRFASSGQRASYDSRAPSHHSAVEAVVGLCVILTAGHASLATPSRRVPVSFTSLGGPGRPSLPRSQPPRFGKLDNCLTCLGWEADSGGDSGRSGDRSPR